MVTRLRIRLTRYEYQVGVESWVPVRRSCSSSWTASRPRRPARADRGRAARGHPLRPAGPRHTAAVDPGAGRRPPTHPQGRGRGLRPAGRRGLPDRPPGGPHRRRSRRRPDRPLLSPPRPPRSRRGRLPTGPARPRPVPAGGLVPGGPCGSPHADRRRPHRRRPARAAGAAVPPWRTTSAGSAGSARIRTGSSSAPASGTASISLWTRWPGSASTGSRWRTRAIPARAGGSRRRRPGRPGPGGRAPGSIVERLRGHRRPRPWWSRPAHQSPTGVVLLARPPTASSLEWARAVDGFVIEDDFDAEYRYDRRPVGCAAGHRP